MLFDTHVFLWFISGDERLALPLREIIRREKVGRNVFFEMDGPAVVAQLEDVLARFRALVPLCCPGK